MNKHQADGNNDTVIIKSHVILYLNLLLSPRPVPSPTMIVNDDDAISRI